MSYLKATVHVFMIIFTIVLFTSVSFAQSALTDDAHVKSSQKPNFGSNPNLTVSSSGNAYVKFKLSSTLPANTPGSQVVKATLKLFIDNVHTGGKIDVYLVTSAWDEATITGEAEPTLGALVATSSQINNDKTGEFVVIDVTSAVQQWLGDDGQGTNGAPNFGLALAVHPIDASTPNLISLSIDSKENAQTSHESELNVQLQTSGGGLTDVAHDQTLNGNGTAANPLGVAASGIGTTQLADDAVTANKIASGQVVTSLNTLKDDVTLSGGSNITITPSANNLTIATTGLLSNIAHDPTLAGNGTIGSPLGVAPLGINTPQLANGGVTEIKIANAAVTANKLAVPLALTSASPGFTLSVANTGTGAAITATGPINTNSQYNIIGQRVLSIPGVSNTFLGLDTGAALTTGANNTLVGRFAGFSNTTGNNNSFFGFDAGRSNTGGSLNSFFGFASGQLNTTGTGNAFFGQTSGAKNTTGNQNSFFGLTAGLENTSGDLNSFFGNNAGVFNSDGSYNSFFGAGSGFGNTSGDFNAFVGHTAGYSNTTGSSNSFFGMGSGQSNTTESGNTFIGSSANGAPGVNNSTAIGVAAHVTQSNSLVLGNNVNVGIGTTAPLSKLHVNGGNILVSAPGQGLILKSPSGATCRVVTIDNAGGLVLMPIACP